MQSIGENCTELKKQYDACFNAWFSEKFLKGHTDESECRPLFKIYSECVRDALKTNNIELRDLERDHLGTEKEEKTPPPKPGSSRS